MSKISKVRIISSKTSFKFMKFVHEGLQKHKHQTRIDSTPKHTGLIYHSGSDFFLIVIGFLTNQRHNTKNISIY